MTTKTLWLVAFLSVAVAGTGRADEPLPGPAATLDDDLEMDKAEPDFTVTTLPTTLRLPRHRMAFRVTHRFTRPLGQGDLGDLAGDFFALDSGAQIGLELRFGLFSGTQVGFQRTSDRTIQFFLHQDLLRARQGGFDAALYATAEGADNFRERHAPGAFLVLSRRLGARGVLYVVPAWVSEREGGRESRVALGLGTRLRLTDSVALVGEYVPRLSNDADEAAGSADAFAWGLEKRVGGHSFQVNFGNGLGTTLGQVVRGGSRDDWFLGFNISRKFF